MGKTVRIAAILACAGCTAMGTVGRAGDAAPSSTETAGAKVKVEKVEFMGWKDSFRLSNGACEMVIVPSIGRVMHFGPAGGENLIWVDAKLAGKIAAKPDNQWHNFGGDKVWPADQAVWGWPPVYEFDCAPAVAEEIPGGVRVTGQVSPRFGAHYVREFVMDPVKPLVYIRQHHVKAQATMGKDEQKDQEVAVPLTIWSVTQVKKPVYSMLQLGDATTTAPAATSPGAGFTKFPQGFVASRFKLGQTVLALENDEKGATKVGVPPDKDYANGWVAAVYDKVMLVESHGLVKGAKYPDNGCPSELYAAGAGMGSYVELELLSPLKDMKKGDTLQDDTIWQLVTVTDEQVKDIEKAGAAAKAAHKAALERLKK